MKKQLVATLFVIGFPLFIGSCMSSLLKDSPPTFSAEIKLTPPIKPFEKAESSIFPSWKSSETGNVISIVSDCSENTPYKLSNLHLMLESSLESITILKEESISLLKRPALLRIVTAKIDGQSIEIQSVSFKRKSCGYVASLSGKEKSLNSDRATFEKFINGFSFK